MIAANPSRKSDKNHNEKKKKKKEEEEIDAELMKYLTKPIQILHIHIIGNKKVFLLA